MLVPPGAVSQPSDTTAAMATAMTMSQPRRALNPMPAFMAITFLQLDGRQILQLDRRQILRLDGRLVGPGVTHAVRGDAHITWL